MRWVPLCGNCDAKEETPPPRHGGLGSWSWHGVGAQGQCYLGRIGIPYKPGEVSKPPLLSSPANLVCLLLHRLGNP